ncbi:hypothetical protein DM806_22770 [Sphingobium lactosutens]|uniref:hypothetical protein n=1 Tax=Sphingobium lactosutens TaxID=522773 RepID=UPI0015B8D908|nr:hypothetical protein [Sphingobium lactosutens]NWK98435.1 hypothetical protein [Sphingobium lactosutens]
MRAVPALLLPLLLLPAACSKSNDVYEELPNSSLAGAPREDVPESRMDAPVARPVIIGEDGPRLDACGTLGQVTRSGSAGLPLRAAPFSDAKALAQLAEGQRAYVCTRRIDQKWLGVVVLPAPPAGNATPPADCGVASPVERKQAYDGPCASGWVASAYVRLIAG